LSDDQTPDPTRARKLELFKFCATHSLAALSARVVAAMAIADEMELTTISLAGRSSPPPQPFSPPGAAPPPVSARRAALFFAAGVGPSWLLVDALFVEVAWMQSALPEVTLVVLRRFASYSFGTLVLRRSLRRRITIRFVL
jgi:hypothetical protein